jgi:nitroreductase
MFEKKAHTQAAIIDALALRWSGRAYDPDRTLSREHLTALLEAARWAPSCFGYQPWRLLLWDRVGTESAWRRAYECLTEGNRAWAAGAPLLMLACADTRFADGRPNLWSAYDTGAPVMSLSAQATALGLMVHQMGGFDADRIRAEFAIPETFDCLAMITVGYQLPPDLIPLELQGRELARAVAGNLASCFTRTPGPNRCGRVEL